MYSMRWRLSEGSLSAIVLRMPSWALANIAAGLPMTCGRLTTMKA